MNNEAMLGVSLIARHHSSATLELGKVSTKRQVPSSSIWEGKLVVWLWEAKMRKVTDAVAVGLEDGHSEDW